MKRTGVAHRHKILFASLGGVVLLLIGAAVGFVVLLSGAMSTAATTQHFSLTHRLLESGLRFSVNSAADDIETPSLEEPGMTARGAACFRDHCTQCHGAPGEARSDAAKGLLPAPNNLVESARAWSPAALYVITRDGVRMTGMPSWGYRLSEAGLWSTVSFLIELPKLTAADYQQLSMPDARCELNTGQPSLLLEDDARVLLQQYACRSCHLIDSVVGPETYVGPPLHEWSRRRYIAGELPNTEDNLTAFLRSPQQVSPGSLMPELEVPEAHARRIAEFLLRP
jgi:mono/diheme cytochrome c family protein